HPRDQVIEQPETRTRVVRLLMLSKGRTPGQEISKVLKPGVRFFWDITEIVRVDVEGSVVGSCHGGVIEGLNLALELGAILWCRRDMFDQRPKDGLALLRGHGMVSVLEDLDQHRGFLLLEKGKEASFIHTICPLYIPCRSRAAKLVRR